MIYNYKIGKHQLLAEGVKICKKFAEVNNLTFPNVAVDNHLRDYGWYLRKTTEIKINLKLCKKPVVNPGHYWSYPGFKSDRTPIGVMAHEFGHHCHFTGGKTILMGGLFIAVSKMEKPVTSYEPNILEIIAESMRLFILNPDLLRQGRPFRYEAYIQLGLKPVIKDTWEEILMYAPAAIKRVAQNWINQRTKL